MLNVAQELNLSETAFVTAMVGSGHYAIRFFSPKMEIPLCGHATLAAAKVLQTDHANAAIYFVTRAGLRLATSRDGEQVLLTMPVYETTVARAPAALLAALGIESVLHAALNEQLRILLLEIDDPQALTRLQPDFHALQASHDGINGVLVTARSIDESADYHYRYFWPWSGTNEDPVTGGVQTFLAPFWSRKLQRKQLRAFQSSARTGKMEVTVGELSLQIRASAVVVFEGRLILGATQE